MTNISLSSAIHLDTEIVFDPNGSTGETVPVRVADALIRKRTGKKGGRECTRDLLNYTDRTRCTREITAARLHCHSLLLSSFLHALSLSLSLFGEVHTVSPWFPHPPMGDEMSVYRGMIDKRIVLPRDLTPRFLETVGGSDVNYRPAPKLTRPRESGSAGGSICTLRDYVRANFSLFLSHRVLFPGKNIQSVTDV